MAETGQTWRITYEGQATGKKDGAFHLHLRAGPTDLDDSWRIAPPAAGGPSQSWLKGALSITGHGRIEELAQGGSQPAMPALSVRGTLADTVGYEVRVDEQDGKLVRGQFEGTDLRRDFRAGDAIAIQGHVDLVARVEEVGEAAGKRLYLTHGVPPEKMPTAGVKPQRDSHLVVVRNGAGEPKLVVDRSGHVTATSFAGALEARHLQGTLALERLPPLPASQITAGTLSVDRIPNLDAAKITSGTLQVDRLPALPVAKISGLQTALDGKLNTSGGTITGALTVKPSTGPAIMILASGESGYGSLNLRYKHEASKHRIGFTDGDGGWMMWSEFSTNNVHVKGNVGIGTEPETVRLKVQGDTSINGHLNVLNGKITGAFEAQHLQGTLALERLPNLPASQITAGTLSVERIPNLDAAKITSGTFQADRIPALPVAKVDGLQATLNGKVNSAGVDNLSIMGGTVASDGAIKGGKGFQVKREDTGLYMITFDRGFSATPSAAVTQVFSTEGDLRKAGQSGKGGNTNDNAVIVGIDEGQMKVKTGASNGGASDRSFTFVVIGPR